MGDRSIIGIRSRGHETLYLYSHWDGADQERILAQGLEIAEPRWGDETYATRILVSHCIGNQWDQETGYGLSVGWWPSLDYDYIYEVDWQTYHVYRVYLDGTGERVSGKEVEYTFYDFINEFRMKGAA